MDATIREKGHTMQNARLELTQAWDKVFSKSELVGLA